MLAITFVIRYSFFAWPDLRFPRAIEQGLHAGGGTDRHRGARNAAAGRQWALSWDNAYLLAGLLAIAIAAVSRNLLATIAGGLLSFFALRWALGQLPI